ncbi:MAG: iron-sulfur cluster assembly scaffold protein [Deltaproteobacteria bacterium]|nr:iron-sulfur cluster assembly scaffold protein [Deltaproteobacteria bacterium]
MNRNVYDDPILQWANRRDHSCTIEHPDRQATATNPLCGDRITIQLKMDDYTIRQMCYQVRGCILCKASCANLAYIAGGLDYPLLKTLRDDFVQFLKSSLTYKDILPHLQVFTPVRSHRSRHRCLLLPYEATLKALLDFEK